MGQLVAHDSVRQAARKEVEGIGFGGMKSVAKDDRSGPCPRQEPNTTAPLSVRATAPAHRQPHSHAPGEHAPPDRPPQRACLKSAGVLPVQRLKERKKELGSEKPSR